jgi:hypothetical protein
VSARQHIEDARNPRQQPSGALQRRNRVLERRRRGFARNGIDLGAVLRQRCLERGQEVLRLHAVERRHPERRLEGGKQRIDGGLRGHRGRISKGYRNVVRHAAPANRP